MTEVSISIDPVWEEKYSRGHAERYPWDLVVSFIYRYTPTDRPRSKVKICEVGFGTGNNLWFAAREGFDVSGIEGSETAVRYAKERFVSEGLRGNLCVGDFQKLPFDDNCFDIVIDRGSLVCVGWEAQLKSIEEIYRTLKPGGKFLYNPYADNHSSMSSGITNADGLTTNITSGTLVGVGGLRFTSKAEIIELFASNWMLHKCERCERIDELEAIPTIHSEWVVIAEKK